MRLWNRTEYEGQILVIQSRLKGLQDLFRLPMESVLVVHFPLLVLIVQSPVACCLVGLAHKHLRNYMTKETFTSLLPVQRQGRYGISI